MPHPFPNALLHKKASAVSAHEIRVTACSQGRPLSDAYLFVDTRMQDGTVVKHMQPADRSGSAEFAFDPSVDTPVFAGAAPASGHWYAADDRIGARIDLDCPPLVMDGPLGWWHRALGIDVYDQDLGAGINVGLIDSGVGPQPCLSHVRDLGALINGKLVPDGRDIFVHGTMMAGLIAARPVEKGNYAGLAPGADVMSIRVYDKAMAGAQPTDVAEAITLMANVEKADLINLSLSDVAPSEVQQRVIRQARSVGTLCIAAAGDDPGPVQYPAQYAETVAVSALGCDVPGPSEGTLQATRPADTGKIGQQGWFLSTMTSYGPALTCAAPGAAVIATVPSSSGVPLYASVIGSSPATALVTGLLAAYLSRDAEYNGLPRDHRRADYAEKALRTLCRSVGLAADYEGQGLPALSD
ncbi:subtilase family protein [Eilatimonas milleporae]|uniref:Subtilase family protein n=1 Tax=Eilatimonas milleporae TaxID=911205 RepID=A0A3M0C4N2_9PROT|nr:subtilase family protein [Eilatimonas milleporae]